MNDVPVVVTLSGVINTEDIKSFTADKLVNFAINHWNIDPTSVDNPFVTVHNKRTNRYRPIQGEEVVGEVDTEVDVVRVVLPLKPKNLEGGDSRQYLVE